MDAPVEAPQAVEAPEAVAVDNDPISTIPDGGDSGSFEAALEAAFTNFNDEADVGGVEDTYEDTDEDTYEDTYEDTDEDTDEDTYEDTYEDDIEDTDEVDLLESLSEDIGDDWTPKAASRFKELKTELKTSRSELDQLRQQSKEYESKIQELNGFVESNDVDQLQSKLAEYEQQQALTNLEATPAYASAVTEPLAALVEQADQIADKYDVDSDALIDVISLDDPQEQEEQLSELLPNASDRDKARIFRIMEEVDPIIQRRDHLSQNAEAALNEAKMLDEKQAQIEASERAALRQNVARNVVSRVQEKLPFLKSIDGLDMDSIQSKASDIDPSVMNPVDHAFNSVSAQLFPSMVRQYMSARTEIEALTDRLAEYESAEPTMSGQTNASAGAGLSDNATFEQRVNAALGAV